MKAKIIMNKKYIVRTLLVIVLILVLKPGYTPNIKGGISILERVEINGEKQRLLIRGESKSNPILLFVHGGPGESDIAYMREYQQELEKEFIVVRWDQRYNKFSTDQIVDDLNEVTLYLLKRFNKEKLFLAGHSWGSYVAALEVQKNPHLYHAFIGIGQVDNVMENENKGFNFVKENILSSGDEKAILKYNNLEMDFTFNTVVNYKKDLFRYGGVFKDGLPNDLLKNTILSTEYSVLNKILQGPRKKKLLEFFFNEYIRIDLGSKVDRFEVPYILFMGAYDKSTDYQLAIDFYNNIDAPYKKFVKFTNSAHMPQIEENIKFNTEMIEIKEILTRSY